MLLYDCCRPLQVYNVNGMGAGTRGDAVSSLCVSFSRRHCKSVGCQHSAVCLYPIWPYQACELCQVGWGWVYPHQLPGWQYHGLGCKGDLLISCRKNACCAEVKLQTKFAHDILAHMA